MDEHTILGIDVGGTGIKGAIVDIQTGELLTERIKLLTPQPATPEAIAAKMAELVDIHEYSGIIGCGFPAVIKKGVIHTAANIDDSCIGVNAEKVFSEATGCPMKVLNDADAAGIAEMYFGGGKGKEGLVLLITIGSGLGSALFIDGKLVPNTELGHIFLNNQVAEHYASNNARKKYDLSIDEWGKRFKKYLQHIERVLSPDHILLGGGISKRFEEFAEFIRIDTPVEPAQMFNAAGTVGAAYYGYRLLSD
ncbi:MAG: ROK family protein [Saprospiraceae bacterium]|nr:ROK family protein [Saprospiraceae bacterium]